jgi:multicomponent Na+:H+ antiporter subunit C
METLLAFLVGLLFAGGVYCLLRRSISRLVIGIILLGQGANLLVFASASLQAERPPIIAAGEKTLQAPYADPIPQALVLTAIVIGFGFIAFALALVYRVQRDLGTDDINSLSRTDSGDS